MVGERRRDEAVGWCERASYADVRNDKAVARD